MEPVTLQTERLVLSIPTEADVDAIADACQDPAIPRYVPVPSPYVRQDAVGFVALTQKWWAAGSDLVWAIRAGDEFCGVVGLHRLAGQSGSGEIGYWLSPGSRGHGYLTEASRAVIDWAFSEPLDLARIEWRAVAGNVPSARVARALGFRYEGLLRQSATTPRTRDDAWIAGLLPDDQRMPQPWPVLED